MFTRRKFVAGTRSTAGLSYSAQQWGGGGFLARAASALIPEATRERGRERQVG